MQRQRATVSSLSEFFDIEHGSPSANAVLNEQSYWANQGEVQASENLPTAPFMSPFIPETQNFLDDQRYSQSNNQFSSKNVNMNPQLGQGSSSRSTPINLNLNPGFVGQGSAGSPLVEPSDTFNPILSEFLRLQPTSSSSVPSSVSSSLGGAHFGEASASRPSSSVEGRVLPSKRKIFHMEGYMGQSSIAGSSSNAQNAESSSWPQANLPIREQVEPRLVLGISGNSERSRRSFNQRNIGPNGSNAPGLYSTNVSSRILAANNMNSLANDSVTAPLLPAPTVHAPAPFPPNGFSIRSNQDMMNRHVSSSSAAVSQGGSLNNTRNILEHSMFVSSNESSNFSQNSTAVQRRVAETFSVLGNTGSSSRSGSHHESSSGNARRLQTYERYYSEMMRRSLNAADSNTIPTYHSRNNTVLSSAAPQEVAIFRSRSGSSRGRRPWPLRQGDNVIGPPPSQTSAAAGEGRRRFLSEIRNVLDMIRRGEALSYEDFMILDQSVVLGAMGQAHDRHRDMRLDVDSMSYEELLALEERIGNVSTGASEETILTQLKQRKFVIADGIQTETEPCCICQEEYNDGEDLGTLVCGHDFHRDCIKQWLKHKNICPICKTTGLKST